MKPTVIDRLRKAETSPAWNRVSAYVIMKGEDLAGKILVKHPKDGIGPLEVFVWDWTDPQRAAPIQYRRASGCGYDKLAAALDGIEFGDILFDNHPTDWKEQLREKGYSLVFVI